MRHTYMRSDVSRGVEVVLTLDDLTEEGVRKIDKALLSMWEANGQIPAHVESITVAREPGDEVIVAALWPEDNPTFEECLP